MLNRPTLFALATLMSLLALSACGGGNDSKVTCEAIVEWPVYGSLEEIWPKAARIVVAERDGAPVLRDSSGGVRRDTPISVEQYLKGSGESNLTVTSVDRLAGCDNIINPQLRLEDGSRYVLFLEEDSEGRWLQLFEPGGFLLDGQMLMPGRPGIMSPAVWGVATLDDLIEQIAALQDESPE